MNIGMLLLEMQRESDAQSMQCDAYILRQS